MCATQCRIETTVISSIGITTLHTLILQVVNGDLNPVWKESFHFLVEDAVQDMVMAQVWDKDTFGKVINVSLHFQIQHFRTYDPPMEESRGN